MNEIHGKSILVRVSEGSSYWESTVFRIVDQTCVCIYTTTLNGMDYSLVISSDHATAHNMNQ